MQSKDYTEAECDAAHTRASEVISSLIDSESEPNPDMLLFTLWTVAAERLMDDGWTREELERHIPNHFGEHS